MVPVKNEIQIQIECLLYASAIYISLSAFDCFECLINFLLYRVVLHEILFSFLRRKVMKRIRIQHLQKVFVRDHFKLPGRISRRKIKTRSTWQANQGSSSHTGQMVKQRRANVDDFEERGSLGTLAVLPSCVAWCAASVTSHLLIGRDWAANQRFWVEVRAVCNPLSQLCPNLKWIGEVWSFQQSLAKTSNLSLAPTEFIVTFEWDLFKSRKTERCKKYYSRSCMTYCKLKVVLYTC